LIEGAQQVNWTNVRAVIFDLDGTLYQQRPVRRRIALRLIGHLLQGRWRDVFAVLHYRRTMEQLAGTRARNVASIQYRATAQAWHLTESQVADLVHEWIHKKPLDLLRHAAYPDVHRVFALLKEKEIRVGVLSDYPALEKLHALALPVEVCCSATDPEIDRLKPEPAGLLHALKLLNTAPAYSLMIGDRLDRDRECADAAGVNFLHCSDTGFFTRLAASLQRY
jgi:FMN phosphatase YigB (HAD superfamily)